MVHVTNFQAVWFLGQHGAWGNDNAGLCILWITCFMLLQALIQGCVGHWQAATTGEGAAAQGPADRKGLIAAQLVAVVKDAFKAAAAAVAHPATIRAPPQKLLSRRRSRQPEVTPVKRQPLAVTASARSAVKRVSSLAEVMEDPRYRAGKRRLLNQLRNSYSLFKYLKPTPALLSSLSGTAVVQGAAASAETVRSHATQTTDHHMAALASDTGVASAPLHHLFTAVIGLLFNTVLLWGLGLSV